MYAACAAQVLLSGQGSRGTFKGLSPKNNLSGLAKPIFFAAMYAACAAQVLLSGQGSRGTFKGLSPKNN